MGMIPERDQQTIREHLSANMAGDVEVIMFTERPSLIIVPGRASCETCEDTRKLLEEVSALSDKIKLTVHEIDSAREQAQSLGIERVPAFVLKGAAKGNVRFFGIPSGYEFSAFIGDLVDASKGTTELSEETRLFLSSLAENVNIKVFTTPTWPYCPAAARMAHQMAVESEQVTADVIEATEFPDLARRYGVRGVPKIVVNDTIEFVGALPEADYVGYVKAAVNRNGDGPGPAAEDV